jgi:hypothetical protein
MINISPEVYNNFCVEYYSSDQTIRFGQSFCNKFNLTDPELFYETCSVRSRIMVFEKYVVIDI